MMVLGRVMFDISSKWLLRGMDDLIYVALSLSVLKSSARGCGWRARGMKLRGRTERG